MNQFVFNSLKRKNGEEISKSIKTLYFDKTPIILCIGSDLVVGDSLGPFIGTILNEKLKGKAFVYGTLKNPVTAKEVLVVKETIKKLHPNSKVIVIDAALGNAEEIGYVKITNCGIKPGLAVNKDLPLLGDVSIIGVVGDKNDKNTNFSTRFSLVYSIANDVIEGIEKLVS